MNLKIFILVILSIAYVLPSLSGVGGSSGGGKFLMVEFCGGESGTDCKMIKIKNRFTEQDLLNAKYQKGDCMMPIGEAQMVPCDPEIESHIPKIKEMLSHSYHYEEGAYGSTPSGY